MDFPNTYEQAKLLEQELSGFRTSDEIPKTELEEKLEKAKILAQPQEVQIVPRKILQSAIDYAFYLNITPEESLRRTLGRRYDKALNA